MGDMLSQDEIQALLGKTEVQDGAEKSFLEEHSESLSEVGANIMTVSMNTLTELLGQEVSIGKPTIREVFLSSLKDEFTNPSIGIRIDYKEGIQGSNVLILTHTHGRIISNLMMGGDGLLEDPEGDLSDIDKSALGEAMNQMIGSSSTVLFKILQNKVDIQAPVLFEIELDEEQIIKDFGFEEDLEIVILTFPLKVGDLIDGQILQMMPKEFALNIVTHYEQRKLEEQQQNSVPQQMEAPSNNAPVQNAGVNTMNTPSNMMQNQGAVPMNQPNNSQQNVNVMPAQFQNFDYQEVAQQKENIDIIMDVPLEVTVEMGRTTKKVEEILEFSPGTVIELEKLAGDPIDILVNGKYVAKGEVVVVDENYGIRVTDIVSVKNRI